MSKYPEVLSALHSLLDQVGEGQWRDWLSVDLIEWAESKSVNHHLQAYGGMGSFNDLIISQKNKHGVTKQHEPWISRLFDDLRSVCYFLAKNLTQSVEISEIEHSMGTVGASLEGWRCLDCGYSDVSSVDIEYYIAFRLVRQGLLQSIVKSRVQDFVEQVLANKIFGAEIERARVRGLLGPSGIEVHTTNKWMCHCPVCKSIHTAVYRWREKGRFRKRFQPTI